MPGLPPDLHRRLCDALIVSGYCDTADALRTIGHPNAELDPRRFAEVCAKSS